jgi:hypothetical protein
MGCPHFLFPSQGLDMKGYPEDIGASARVDYYRKVLMELRGHNALKDGLMKLALTTKAGKKSNDHAEWLPAFSTLLYC